MGDTYMCYTFMYMYFDFILYMCMHRLILSLYMYVHVLYKS